jgi:hypothetical protein
MPAASPPVYKDWLFTLPNHSWARYGMPKGTMLCLHYHAAPRDGDLVLVIVNDCLMMARWFSRIAGFSWLIMPGRVIQVVKRSLVAILGVLKPMVPGVGS